MMLYISSNKPATRYQLSQYRPRVMTDVFINMAMLDFHAMFADNSVKERFFSLLDITVTTHVSTLFVMKIIEAGKSDTRYIQ